MSDETEIRLTDEPNTLEEWLYHLKRYENVIFVRDKVDGKFDSFALAELPPEQWAKNIARWIKEGVIPARVVEITYEVHFRRQMRIADDYSLMAGPFVSPEEAKEHRVASGDLVVDRSTMKIVCDDSWLFDSELNDETSYARKAIAWQKERNENGS